MKTPPPPKNLRWKCDWPFWHVLPILMQKCELKFKLFCVLKQILILKKNNYLLNVALSDTRLHVCGTWWRSSSSVIDLRPACLPLHNVNPFAPIGTLASWSIFILTFKNFTTKNQVLNTGW